jgi:hypothetical protein
MDTWYPPFIFFAPGLRFDLREATLPEANLVGSIRAATDHSNPPLVHESPGEVDDVASGVPDVFSERCVTRRTNTSAMPGVISDRQEEPHVSGGE